ncbi:MAG: sugar phosphate isomerase/epimerase family protein [Agriterribacter sp.]
MLTRRSLLKKSLLISSLMQAGVFKELMAASSSHTIKIGACDWSIGKWSNIGAFETAKQIGLEGIMVDMGSVQNDLHIRKSEVQEAYKKESAKTGVAISSVAMGLFNSVPFHSEPRVPEWITDTISTAKNFNVKVILLAFFNASDLRNDASRKAVAVKHLKAVIPAAEAAGVTLGIESYLDAKEHLEIMDKVGSNNLKVYYDFRNTADAGHDTVAEFKKLGKNNVCELHMKENDFLLDKGTINWSDVSKAIYEIGYKGDGWMQIEGATPKGADIIESYRHNLAYLQKLFNK